MPVLMTLARLLVIVSTCSVAVLGAAGRVGAQPSDRQIAANYSFSPPMRRPAIERVVREYVDDDDAVPHLASASMANLETSEELRKLIDTMLQASPTFRRQCTRLAADQRLSIVVAVAALDPSRSSRATTQFGAGVGGRLVARVLLKHGGPMDELIAHEFEHVLEQLDGVDLESLARRQATGVSVVDGSRFETVRAVAIGRQVAEEIRSARRQHE
jgi:hypothetical protein